MRGHKSLLDLMRAMERAEYTVGEAVRSIDRIGLETFVAFSTWGEAKKTGRVIEDAEGLDGGEWVAWGTGLEDAGSDECWYVDGVPGVFGSIATYDYAELAEDFWVDNLLPLPEKDRDPDLKHNILLRIDRACDDADMKAARREMARSGSVLANNWAKFNYTEDEPDATETELGDIGRGAEAALLAEDPAAYIVMESRYAAPDTLPEENRFHILVSGHGAHPDDPVKLDEGKLYPALGPGELASAVLAAEACACSSPQDGASLVARAGLHDGSMRVAEIRRAKEGTLEPGKAYSETALAMMFHDPRCVEPMDGLLARAAQEQVDLEWEPYELTEDELSARAQAAKEKEEIAAAGEWFFDWADRNRGLLGLSAMAVMRAELNKTQVDKPEDEHDPL